LGRSFGAASLFHFNQETIMAKKAKAARKSKKVRKAKAPAAVPIPAGTVTVSRSVDVPMTFTSPTSGVRINLDHIGIGKGADAVAETSGNSRYTDAVRPPAIEGDSLLVFFDPQLEPGTYGFSFTFKWSDEMETVIPAPLKDGAYDGVADD
jgi:hypothetical protein